MGKNMKKNIYIKYIYMCVCVYSKLNHFAMHLKHCKSTILQFEKNVKGIIDNKIVSI